MARQYGGIYSTHMRDEGAGVFRSVEEAIAIGKGAGIRVDIIHLKIADKKFWGQMNEVIAMIRKAVAASCEKAPTASQPKNGAFGDGNCPGDRTETIASAITANGRP